MTASTVWNTFADPPEIVTVPQPPPPAPTWPIIAVGLAGIRGSQNGSSWTNLPGPYDSTYPHNGYLCVTYATHLGMWIVGTGYNNDAPHAIITSSDGGNTWDLQTTPWDGNASAWSLAYSFELGLIVAVNNRAYYVNEAIMISHDGIHWTSVSSYWDYSAGGDNIEDVGWIPFLNQFVLVADGSRPTGGATTTQCIGISIDGTTWIPQSSPVDVVPSPGHPDVCFMFGVNHSNNEVFALGSFDTSPSDVELYSSDASSWTLNAEGSTPYNVYDLAYHSGTYIRGTNAGGTYGQTIQYSFDGRTWSQAPGTYALISYVNHMIWSPTANMFIAVGADNPPVGTVTSSDGVNWTGYSTGMMFDVWDYAAS